MHATTRFKIKPWDIECSVREKWQALRLMHWSWHGCWQLEPDFWVTTRSQPSVEVALLTLKPSALNSFIKQGRKHLPLWGVVKWSRLWTSIVFADLWHHKWKRWLAWRKWSMLLELVELRSELERNVEVSLLLFVKTKQFKYIVQFSHYFSFLFFRVQVSCNANIPRLRLMLDFFSLSFFRLRRSSSCLRWRIYRRCHAWNLITKTPSIKAQMYGRNISYL